MPLLFAPPTSNDPTPELPATTHATLRYGGRDGKDQTNTVYCRGVNCVIKFIAGIYAERFSGQKNQHNSRVLTGPTLFGQKHTSSLRWLLTSTAGDGCTLIAFTKYIHSIFSSVCISCDSNLEPTRTKRRTYNIGTTP